MEGRKVTGWAARDASAILSPYSYHLRKTGPEDILFKGIVLWNRSHRSSSDEKHEVVGQVVELGSEVKRFAIGDIVGVGSIISSCGECSACQSNLEQYCNKVIPPYNDIYKDGSPTQGGFSSAMVVHQKFVVKIPENLAPQQAAPLLCAGVTAYSPLKQFIGSAKALNAGILGLGGVGHLGVLIAKAMGHHVTVVSSSNKKRAKALV